MRRKRLYTRLYGDAVAPFESVSSLENELEIRPPKQSLRTIQRSIN